MQLNFQPKLVWDSQFAGRRGVLLSSVTYDAWLMNLPKRERRFIPHVKGDHIRRMVSLIWDGETLTNIGRATKMTPERIRRLISLMPDDMRPQKNI